MAVIDRHARGYRAPILSMGLAASNALAACGDAESTVASEQESHQITVHGFLLEGDVLTTIEPPGDVILGDDGQEPFELLDINNHGQMAGYFTDDEGTGHGFVRDEGVFTPIDFPGAGGTTVGEVLDDGTMVGTYTDVGDDPFTSHGFVLEDGAFTTIDLPDALATSVSSMNNEGQMLGTFVDADGGVHGFLLKDGEVTPIDFPGATVTIANKLNDKGQAVGYFSETDATLPVTRSRGFVRDDNGAFTRIDAPDAGPVGTVPVGINNDTTVVGAYVGSDDDRTLSFRRDGETYRTIDLPEADAGVGALDMNDQQQIVGVYTTVGDERVTPSSPPRQ